MFGHLMEIVFAVVIMYYIILKSKKKSVQPETIYIHLHNLHGFLPLSGTDGGFQGFYRIPGLDIMRDSRVLLFLGNQEISPFFFQ